MQTPARKLIALLTLALLLLAGAGVAGCFGGGSDDSVGKVLDQTFNGDKKVNSGKLSMEISANLKGAQQLSGPIKLDIVGPFEGLEEKIKDTNKLPRADLKVNVNAAGQSFDAGGISTGDKLFVKARGTNYVVPADQFAQLKRQLESAQEQNDKKKEPNLDALGIHPREWLKDPSDDGTEDVGGTQTIHVSAGVNVSRLLEDFDRLLKRAGELGLSQQQQQQLPNGIPKSTRDQIAGAVKEAKLDLYTGKDDKVLRRFDLRLKFELPENLRGQAGGLESGDLRFAYQVAELNQSQTISEPKSARPLRELQRQLQGSGLGALGGSLGGSSGSGSSGGSSSGGNQGGGNADSRNARRYLKCVEGAKSQAELNRCANLVR